MSCPKNIKRIWIFSFRGPHSPAPASIEVWGNASWLEYEVVMECRACGARVRGILSEHELVERGIDPRASIKACAVVTLAERDAELRARIVGVLRSHKGDMWDSFSIRRSDGSSFVEEVLDKIAGEIVELIKR